VVTSALAEVANLNQDLTDERRRYYQFLWETGGAQTDAANMAAENIDWKNRQLVYRRSKTGTPAYISIGAALERLPLLPLLGWPFFSYSIRFETDKQSYFISYFN